MSNSLRSQLGMTTCPFTVNRIISVLFVVFIFQYPTSPTEVSPYIYGRNVFLLLNMSRIERRAIGRPRIWPGLPYLLLYASMLTDEYFEGQNDCVRCPAARRETRRVCG